jgi:hypothetical protein
MEFCSSPATRNTGGQDLSPIRIARGSRETLWQRRRQRNIWGAPDCQRIAVAQRTTAQRQNDSSNRLISNLRARRALIGLSCRWELHISSFSMWPRRILTPINAARRKDLNAKHREDVRSKIRRSWHSFAREHRESRSFWGVARQADIETAVRRFLRGQFFGVLDPCVSVVESAPISNRDTVNRYYESTRKQGAPFNHFRSCSHDRWQIRTHESGNCRC